MFGEFRENFQLTWKVLGNEYFDLGCGGLNQTLEFNFEENFVVRFRRR